MFCFYIKRIQFIWYGAVTYYVVSYKLDVIDTYRLRSISVYWSGLGRNCYGTKRKFTRVFVPIIFYFEGAILITYLHTDHTNPQFQKFSAVIKIIKIEIDKFNVCLDWLQLQWTELDLKESICSVRVPSLPIWWHHFNFIPIFVTILCHF